MSLAEQYREKIRGTVAGSDPTEDLVALCFARDLMKGDPAQFKAGYTAENAALAALEVFPDADKVELEVSLGIREPAPEPEPTSCGVCGADLGSPCAPDLCKRRVVIVESKLGDNEAAEYLIEHPLVLTADHIELTVEGLIDYAKEQFNPDAILVAEGEGWKTAEDWLAERHAGCC